MVISLFDYRDYRDYIDAQLEELSQGKRGLKGELAKAIGSQNAFVSQVLGKHAHFNLEHGEKVNRFFGHSEEEAHFFLLMVSRTRAGTRTLEDYFERQMQQVIQSRLVMKNRFKVTDVLSDADKATYYSSWIYGAIRVLLTVPAFRTRDAIAKRLGLAAATIGNALDFLSSRGLIEEKERAFLPTTTSMNLGTDSPLLGRHHTNWRMQAIAALDEVRTGDLHYSSVISMSRDDAFRIKKLLVDFIEEVRGIYAASPEEDAFVFNADLFRL